MVRKRSARKKRGTKGRAGSSMNNGCSPSSNSKFEAFEFNDDDLLVEDESRKSLDKFGTRSPSKKHVNRRKSLDKYDFLKCFVLGSTSKQKHVGYDELHIDATDGVSQERTFAKDVGMSLDSLNYEPGPLSSLECQRSECTYGLKSCLAKRSSGCHTAGKMHNQVLHLDSNEDDILELRPLGSSINMRENEGSLNEQSSEYGANSNDCEAVVVVEPYYIKHGNKYYTGCRLIFSQRCIRLEGSPVCDEWSTSGILNIEHQHCESVKAEVINLYVGYKDANADETCNLNLGSLELEFVILDDPRWSEKQEEIKSLDLKYKSSWKTTMTECCFEESFEEVVYPEGDPDAVIITRRDTELLRPGTFINDTIIDFYIRYLLSNTKPEEQQRFHFFNTFFFQKLYAAGSELYRGCSGRDAFQSVRKWTRNVNLFEKDFIFIPVNSRLHWSLIIICHPGAVAYLNKDMNGSSKVPCILHMDSIRGSHKGFEKLIRSYLWDQWKERDNEHDEGIAVAQQNFSCLKFVPLQLPQQENSFDCGLFLLHYAELFLMLASNCSTTKYTDFSEQLNQDWFFPAEVSLKKRCHIRKLIHSLIQENAPKDPPAASNNKNLQTLDGVLGESSMRSVLKNGGNKLCRAINFSLEDAVDDSEQQALMLEQINTGKTDAEECNQSSKLRLPINQFKNMSLPMEEAFADQTTSVVQRDTGSKCKTDDVMHTCCQLNPFLAGEASKTCSIESTVATAVEIEEDYVLIETQNEGDEISSMESEDLAACVVDDSEDEREVESNQQRTRRHFSPNCRVGSFRKQPNTSPLEGKQRQMRLRGKSRKGYVNDCIFIALI